MLKKRVKEAQEDTVVVMVRFPADLHKSIQLRSVEDGLRGKASPMVLQILKIIDEAYKNYAHADQTLSAYLSQIIRNDARVGAVTNSPKEGPRGPGVEAMMGPAE